MFFYIISGFASGVLGGMGMGGGTVLIPILTIFLGVKQHFAQAINLISFIPMAVIALIFHSKNKYVIYKKSYYIIIPALVGCVGGCYLARAVSNDILQKIFGGFLLALSLVQGFFAFKNKE